MMGAAALCKACLLLAASYESLRAAFRSQIRSEIVVDLALGILGTAV